MNLVEHLVKAVEMLVDRLSKHDSLLADAQAAQKAAEDKVSGLEAQVADLTAKVEAELDPAPVQSVIDKIEAITGKADDSSSSVASAPASAEQTSSDETAQTVAPVVTQTPSGAIATVDPTVGATTHEDGDGVTTTVPHDGSEPSAINAAGQSVQPASEAVAEAVQASAEAGVTVAAPAAI